MTVFPGGAISYNVSSIKEVFGVAKNLGESTRDGCTFYAVLGEVATLLIPYILRSFS